MKVILLPAAIAALITFAAPAQAAPILSETFAAGVGTFSVDGAPYVRATPRNFQYCCGVTGSDTALDKAFIAFGPGNAMNEGSISTEIQTVVNTLYTLTFRAGAFGAGVTNLSYAVGGIGGTLELLANNNADETYQTYSLNFVGTGEATKLTFFSRGPGLNIDPVLNDVSVSAAVPEPATWAMMIAGFGAIGGALRRRNVRVAFA